MPYVSYEAMREQADAFLRQHWPERDVPIDIEKIADVRLGLDIVEVEGLKRQLGIDGFLSRDRGTIYIDRQMSESNESRFRFTLAHEIAHREWHQALYEYADFATPEEWLEFQQALPRELYARYEHQAYCYAGLLLVPKEALRVGVDRATAHAKAHNYNVNLEDDADRAYVAEWVADDFEVSASVILKRGKYDGLWTKE